MKKLFSNYLILVVVICFGFSGCDTGKQINNTEEMKNTITVSPSPTIAVPSDITVEEDSSANQVKVTKDVPNIIGADYSDCFNGMEGCAVFKKDDSSDYTMYNKELCEKEVSPCSTFKIIATIMGLEKGIITSVDSKMDYDGTMYSVDKWNKDLNLKDAFKESCVWYFRKVIDQVGQSNVQRYLDQLKYGNCDISEWNGSGINPLPQLNGFWLESSLEISPKEQVDILTDIFNGKTDFSDENINILKEVMLTQINESVMVYGKTGSGINPKTKNRDNGWFVGRMESSNGKYSFAVHLHDKNKSVSGPMAKEVALSIINRYYVKK